MKVGSFRMDTVKYVLLLIANICLWKFKGSKKKADFRIWEPALIYSNLRVLPDSNKYIYIY